MLESMLDNYFRKPSSLWPPLNQYQSNLIGDKCEMLMISDYAHSHLIAHRVALTIGLQHPLPVSSEARHKSSITFTLTCRFHVDFTLISHLRKDGVR